MANTRITDEVTDNPTENRKRMIDVLYRYAVWSVTPEPLFRLVAEGKADPATWGVSGLKSDHIKNDNWLFRK